MEGSETRHVESSSCALCESRRGVSVNCCCPNSEKDLAVITEEKLRRRAGIGTHDKICPDHAKKLKSGLIFGASSLYECCAPFHVKTLKSPGLLSLPRSWKPYFNSPTTENGNRYRPRQRICRECYMIALEVINSDRCNSSDEEDDDTNSVLSSSSFDFGYVSPRRWASNLSLLSSSSHGSQHGSSWSLTPNPSPSSLTLSPFKHLDNASSNTSIKRKKAMLAGMKLQETPNKSREEVFDESAQPSSPDNALFAAIPQNIKNILELNDSARDGNTVNENLENPEQVISNDVCKSGTQAVSKISPNMKEDYPDTSHKPSLEEKSKENSNEESKASAESTDGSYESRGSEDHSETETDSNSHAQEDNDKSSNSFDSIAINKQACKSSDPGAEKDPSDSDRGHESVASFADEFAAEKPEEYLEVQNYMCGKTDMSYFLSKSQYSESTLPILEETATQEISQDRSCSPTKTESDYDEKGHIGNTNTSEVFGEAEQPTDRNQAKHAIPNKTDSTGLNDFATRDDTEQNLEITFDKETNHIVNNLDSLSAAHASYEEEIPFREANKHSLGELMADDVSQSYEARNQFVLGRADNDIAAGITPGENSMLDRVQNQEDSGFRFDPIVKWTPEGEDCMDQVSSNDSGPDELIDGQWFPESMEKSDVADNGTDADISKQLLSEDEDNEEKKYSESVIMPTQNSSHDVIEVRDISQKSGNIEISDHTAEDETLAQSVYLSEDIIPQSSAFHYQNDTSSESDNFDLHTIEEESFQVIVSITPTESDLNETAEVVPPERQKDVNAPMQRGLRRKRASNFGQGDTMDGNSPDFSNAIALDDNETPPHTYMQQRRKVRFDDESTRTNGEKQIENFSSNEQNAGLSASTICKRVDSESADEAVISLPSASKTDLYEQLHGSKENADDSTSNRQVDVSEVLNDEPRDYTNKKDSLPTSTTNTPELHSGNSADENDRIQHLRRRMKNNRSVSLDATSSPGLSRGLQRKSSVETNTDLSKRRSVWTDKRRKFGVSIALPTNVILEEIVTEAARGKLIEEPVECTSIVRDQRIPCTAECEKVELMDEELENETVEKPTTLRESRRVPNRGKHKQREEAKENGEEKAQAAEDEDVSAVLPEIFTSVFTTKTLSEWLKSLNDSSLPLLIIAGISITAVVSISLLAFFTFVH